MALDILGQKGANVDLIVSDVMMPEIDGFTLLETIRNDEKWSLVPIVLLTARADIQDKLRALTIGVDDYIIKPFEPEELSTRVVNLLDRMDRRFIEIANPEIANPEIASENKVKVRISQKTNTTQKEYQLLNKFDEMDSADFKWLKEVEQIAIDNILEPNFNVHQFAYKVHLGDRQLGRRLKRLTGMTTGSYLKEVRLQKARHLLEQKTYATVSQVAFSVGFSTPEYFSKIFKKRFGKLPSEYIKPVSYTHLTLPTILLV